MRDGSNILTVYAEARRTGPGVAQQIDHAHHQIEFNLVLSGRGAYFVEDGQHDLAPGTLVWLLPGQSHRLMRSPDFDMWVVTCDADAFDDSFLADVAEHPCRILATEDVIALDRLLSHISQDVEEPSVYRAGLEYAVRSARYASLTTAGPVRKRLHPAVLQALSILRSNAETPTAGTIAKMCGVNQDYLGQLLAEQTGRGFVEWRNRTRLERFHILYPESGDLLTAALAAGFGSYAQFHRVFVDLIGTTPGDWAKSGASARSLGLPSDAGAIQAGAGGSTRMACYGLCGLPFPIVEHCLGQDFARAFAEGAATGSRLPFDSGARRDSDLRRHEAALVADLMQKDPVKAEKMARIFARNDIFESYRRAFPYDLAIDDLANAVGMYLMFAWIVANRRSYPNWEQITAVLARARGALHATRRLERISLEQRELLTAALLAQIMILRHALVGAGASTSGATRVHISDRVSEAALAALGMDLRSIPLIEPQMRAPIATPK